LWRWRVVRRTQKGRTKLVRPCEAPNRRRLATTTIRRLSCVAAGPTPGALGLGCRLSSAISPRRRRRRCLLPGCPCPPRRRGGHASGAAGRPGGRTRRRGRSRRAGPDVHRRAEMALHLARRDGRLIFIARPAPSGRLAVTPIDPPWLALLPGHRREADRPSSPGLRC
jgi:hypothetical protein